MFCLFQHARYGASASLGERANPDYYLYVEDRSCGHQHRNSYEQPYGYQLPRHVRGYILIRNSCETHGRPGEGRLLCRLEWRVQRHIHMQRHHDQQSDRDRNL